MEWKTNEKKRKQKKERKKSFFLTNKHGFG
jgi:hypothetical protein